MVLSREQALQQGLWVRSEKLRPEQLKSPVKKGKAATTPRYLRELSRSGSIGGAAAFDRTAASASRETLLPPSPKAPPLPPRPSPKARAQSERQPRPQPKPERPAPRYYSLLEPSASAVASTQPLVVAAAAAPAVEATESAPPLSCFAQMVMAACGCNAA